MVVVSSATDFFSRGRSIGHRARVLFALKSLSRTKPGDDVKLSVMGDGDSNLRVPGLPDIGTAAAAIVTEAERVGGAILLFDEQDRVAWVNEHQRLIMPCSSYQDETYAGLFWAALNAGMTGNPAARQYPAEWLALATVARASEPWLQTLNHYRHGAMALTHRRIDRGWSMQIRFPVRPLDAQRPGDLLVTSSAATREAEALRHALDRLDLGVAIVGLTGECLFANAALKDLVFRDAGIGMVAGRLRPTRAYDRRWWHRALAAAGPSPNVRIIDDRTGSPALVLSVTEGMHYGTAVALAAPVRPHIDAATTHSIVSLLDVPRPVAEVLTMMAMGETVDRIASTRDSTPGTVYQQVARAKRATANRRLEFAASSHVQLAALVLQIAATTGAPAARVNEETEGNG